MAISINSFFAFFPELSVAQLQFSPLLYSMLTFDLADLEFYDPIIFKFTE